MQVEEKEISRAVIKRLPRYYRYLGELLESGTERISSGELSERMQVTASQIRQDLNNFGGFGQQGYGYNVKHLHTEIGKILGLDQDYNMIIIGAGNLGQALANYVKFEKNGFLVKGLFDVNPKLKGVAVRGIVIRMTDELPAFLQEHDIQIAALTLPKQYAKEMADFLVDHGIRAIWNFAHTDLHLPEDHVVVFQKQGTHCSFAPFTKNRTISSTVGRSSAQPAGTSARFTRHRTPPKLLFSRATTAPS